MTRLEQLRQQHAAHLVKMDAFNVQHAEHDLEAEEHAAAKAEWEGLKVEATRISAAIDREKEREAFERTAPAARPTPGNPQPHVATRLRAEDDPRRGFAGPREFMLSVIESSGARSREDVADERLRPLAVVDREDRQAAGALAFLMPGDFNPSLLAAAGSDEQGGYSDPHGGFLRTTGFIPRILQLGFEGDPTMGRTQDIPMASVSVEIPARVDKNHTSSVSGGFTVTRKPETVAATSSRGTFELVSLKATSKFGLAFATEEILVDSPISFVAIIDSGLRDQFAHDGLREKLRGLGGAEYIGVINADAGIAVTRNTSNRILGTDVLAMRARCWGYGRAIWIANHDTFGEIFRLGSAAFDTEGATPLAGTNGLFRSSLGEDMPNMLLGQPIFFSEYASTLGDKGDLILADWSQYLEGIYQPLNSAESMHVRFVEHERAFKFWLRNAGAPWWRSALTPNQSTTTLSPIVTIAA